MLKPYFTNELGILYNCDCKELLKELKTDSIDLIFTSPPYNTGNSGKNKDMYKDYDDNLSNDEYYNLLYVFLEESLRICKGPIFLNMNYMVNNKKVLYKIISDFSEYLRENIIWDKGYCQPPIGNILGKRYEYIFFFTKNSKFEINTFKYNKGKNYTENFGNWISNLIKVSLKTDQTKFSRKHRAGFPIDLPKIFIDIYTKKGDIVLDPFMGLGSTAMSAELIDRRWIGSELIKNYCDIIKKRLEEVSSKLF